MNWLQAHVLTDAERAGEVESALAAIGALSVTLGDAADEPVLEPAPGETPLWRDTVVTGLFEEGAGPEALAARVVAALGASSDRPVRVERLADQVWERAWLDHFRPMRFGGRLWVVPGGQAVDLGAGEVAIALDPGLAFGTGTHPSTALCLEWLAAQALDGRDVIDFGCGSGILAVAALRLGARRAVAVDHDPQALLATRENAERNGVDGRLDVRSDRDTVPPAAPIVVANILAGTLAALAPRIAALVAPGGRLALAGILTAQAGDVVAAYRGAAGSGAIDLAVVAERDGWVLLAGTRG
ncbi:MAG: 50S ribosomal protein L11 methyltransferase [Gammaproteobacteria bacterium]|jgi:ribosomal protein L11 methyltransferase|nr:50S ribosomal protein L11 methyltransferase [Gammaproteobacteria bacterium]